MKFRTVILSLLVVFWPALLWGCGFALAVWLSAYGCEISARGPSPCWVLGTDIGEEIYPLWALGYLLIPVIGWIPLGLLILGAIWLLRRKTGTR